MLMKLEKYKVKCPLLYNTCYTNQNMCFESINRRSPALSQKKKKIHLRIIFINIYSYKVYGDIRWCHKKKK